MLARIHNGANSVNRLRAEMDRLFGSLLGEGLAAPFGWAERAFPAMNIWENAESVFVEAEIPGMKLEDLELTAMGNELTIKGERKRIEDAEACYHRQERGVGTFVRTVRLPVDVNADKVEATFKDGVLTVVLPKSEAARPRKITVKPTH